MLSVSARLDRGSRPALPSDRKRQAGSAAKAAFRLWPWRALSWDAGAGAAVFAAVAGHGSGNQTWQGAVRGRQAAWPTSLFCHGQPPAAAPIRWSAMSPHRRNDRRAEQRKSSSGRFVRMQDSSSMPLAGPAATVPQSELTAGRPGHGRDADDPVSEQKWFVADRSFCPSAADRRGKSGCDAPAPGDKQRDAGRRSVCQGSTRDVVATGRVFPAGWRSARSIYG